MQYAKFDSKGKSIVPWVGGKSLLAKTIISNIPEHVCYVEPFAGGASVFLRKTPSSVEVINDINKELINLYRVIKHHKDEFLKQFDNVLVSRDIFNKLKKTPTDTLTDVQRATRFFYLQKQCFGGSTVNPSFGIAKTDKPRLNLDTIDDIIAWGYNRLKRTYIECLPYADLINKYDGKNTFFYVDPPYWGTEDYYGKEYFNRDDFQLLKDILGEINGKFLLSINDVPEIRKLFNDFNILEVETRYSLSGKSNRVGELLIKNY